MPMYRALTRIYIGDTIREPGEVFHFEGKPGKSKSFEPVNENELEKKAKDDAKALEEHGPEKFGMERGLPAGPGSLSRAHEVVAAPIESDEERKAKGRAALGHKPAPAPVEKTDKPILTTEKK